MDFLKNTNQEGNQQAPTQQSQEGAGGLFNKLSGAMGGGNQQQNAPQQSQGLGDKVNSMFGGGQAGEQKEDKLDKGIDFVQERVLGQGQQSNESAMEQAKDKQIADAIRRSTGYQ